MSHYTFTTLPQTEQANFEAFLERMKSGPCCIFHNCLDLLDTQEDGPFRNLTMLFEFESKVKTGKASEACQAAILLAFFYDRLGQPTITKDYFLAFDEAEIQKMQLETWVGLVTLQITQNIAPLVDLEFAKSFMVYLAALYYRSQETTKEALDAIERSN